MGILMGERAERACLVGPLVRFDRERFRSDVRAEIERRGYGARARLSRESGINRGSLRRLLDENTSLRSVEALFTIGAYLGLCLDRYMIWRDEMNPPRHYRGASPRIDWKLFGGCATMICAGSIAALSQTAGISLRQASHILAGEGCGWQDFLRICRIMNVADYNQFILPEGMLRRRVGVVRDKVSKNGIDSRCTDKS